MNTVFAMNQQISHEEEMECFQDDDNQVVLLDNTCRSNFLKKLHTSIKVLVIIMLSFAFLIYQIIIQKIILFLILFMLLEWF